MSITNELRKCLNSDIWLGRENTRKMLLKIADRIDAEHKRAIRFADDRDPETMAENGWVRLPKDADYEYIHLGDRVENNEKVVRIVLTDESWDPYVYVERKTGILHEYFCSDISHCCEPTVDELLDQLDGLRGNGADYEDVVTRASDIAKKLRELLKEHA